jgi:two-component system LytT family sensor kinase
MSELLNLVGLSAGVVLYTVLLVMVIRNAPKPVGGARFDPLLLATAILGLIWNLCALPAYELPKLGIAGPFPFLVAIGFSALGLLPAVVVHSVLRGRRAGLRGGIRVTLTVIAYGVSATAATLHFQAAWIGAALPSVAAMRTLTYTFVALIVPVAMATRGQPGSRRALWVAALAAFAVSALHLSNLHSGDASWPVELIGHHASLPLAFAILYQDYPFALADLFLKRALVLLALVAVAFATIALFGEYSTAFARLGPQQVGLVVTLWVGTALLYPVIRRSTAWFVDSILLARPDYRLLRASVIRRIEAHDDVHALLSDLCDQLRPALSARRVQWREWSGATDQSGIIAQADGLLVIVATADAPRYVIEVSEVTGGRRFLSDDLATLDLLSAAAARRIDGIRITNERYEREIRDQELEKLATQAELRTLRAQLNPHFLFNALTTIGHLIQAAPPRALETLLRLTSLLRAVLRSEGEYTTLGREMEMVAAYLDIERARFEWRLRTELDVPRSLAGLRVPPLVLQPIVENAVKHGISKQRQGGDVRVSARVERDGDVAPQLVLTVSDTGAGAEADELRRGRLLGVGLQNVERRLSCQYGASASLRITTEPNAGTTVEIRVPVRQATAADAGVSLEGAAR